VRKVLIANRGEIAVRIIRACRELGLEAVAVYSTADRLAPHVLLADEAWPIGDAPSAQSYLRADVLIDTALKSGCDAVHPGYGFLSERAFFAEAVEAAGLIFIGPTAAAIRDMGDKTQARRRMIAAGVPVVPGTTEPLVDVDDAIRAAEAVGYPIMIKAIAGGGGKGMRIVRGPAEVPRAFEAAQHEARTAFGDAGLYMECFLERPRHIEIQVLADAFGNTVHLGERECSIQRRHQKMIEESPSTALTPGLRHDMGAAAVAAAKAVAYRNAGTIEFLFADGEYFFLEMNTRIQVEHPVTELVTGIDLVQWQLRVAAGEALSFSQDDVRIEGHSIECRITSEDPFSGFLPSTGRIERIDIPAGPGVRWDGAVSEGYEVSLFYDPMLAKLIVHANDREAAIDRMQRALAETVLLGVETSVPFHRRVMLEPDFRAGRLDIRYVESHPGLVEAPSDDETLLHAALAAALAAHASRTRRSPGQVADHGDSASRWRETGWRS
jgi:acetyl-CoA carboxylase, biotin carboxylase subunit